MAQLSHASQYEKIHFAFYSNVVDWKYKKNKCPCRKNDGVVLFVK